MKHRFSEPLSLHLQLCQRLPTCRTPLMVQPPVLIPPIRRSHRCSGTNRATITDARTVDNSVCITFPGNPPFSLFEARSLDHFLPYDALRSFRQVGLFVATMGSALMTFDSRLGGTPEQQDIDYQRQMGAAAIWPPVSPTQA